MQNFFWPGMYSDISRYCKSCSTYQKGTANGITPKARLVRIPPIDDPFLSVAIDFVGSLPMTEKKNRYILVCVGYATQYPEAFPMRSQDAESVANALIEMFSRVGVRTEIISDQGRNFMSVLISELCKMPKVQKISTTPIILKQTFNGTLKKRWKAYLNRQNGIITYHMCYLLIEKYQTRQQVSLPSNFFMLGMYEDL